MFKALLKKQMLEIRTVYLTGRKGKNGRRKQTKNPAAMLVLLGFLYLLIMFSFFGLSALLGSSLFPAGLDWLFFTVMNVIAFLLGVVGSVLSTASALFSSKENELLLSMPIPPSMIVAVRMISVLILGFIYEAAVLIPVVVYYLINGNVTVKSAVFSILGIFVMGFLVTAVSCFAGWVVSIIAVKLKNQKIISVILIVIFLGLFYYFRFRIEYIMRDIAANAEKIAASMNGWWYPVYAPGMGMAGNTLAFVLFVIFTAVLFAVAYYAVTRSFSRIALAESSGKKAAFKNEYIRVSAVQNTLLKKELKRFTASVTYMLNSGLGILLLLAGTVIIIIEWGDGRQLLADFSMSFPDIDIILPVIVAAAVCVLTSFCMMCSCSISLEGNNIWIYQTMPLDPYSIFMAKIRLHVLLTGIPALICVTAVGAFAGAKFFTLIIMAVFTEMYIVTTAFLELKMDLKRPKLDWTNENQAVKNNLNVFADMMVSMFVPVVIGGLYWLLYRFIGPEIYMVIWIAVFAGITLLTNKWMLEKGRGIFSCL